MITIYKNTENTVCLTLTERAQYTQSVFLFKFTREISNQQIIFTAENISDNTERYDKFIIEEVDSDNEDLSIGKVNLAEGKYHYQIYEAPETSPQSLDPDDYSPALEIVEDGFVMVTDPSDTGLSTYTADDDDNVLPIYTEE